MPFCVLRLSTQIFFVAISITRLYCRHFKPSLSSLGQESWTCSSNELQRDFFRNPLFRFKIRLETFWMDSEREKNVFFKNFGRPFSLFCRFRLKTVESQRKHFNGNFFRNRLFRFRIRFQTFWIDSEQKMSFKNFGRSFSNLCLRQRLG